jgi:predicted 3-demethylubiquinone-9 3-methyltransferase (glyoxalase superfamily)
MTKLFNCLWFETEAEEAARFYASVFRDAKLGPVMRAPAGGEPHTTEGKVLTAEVTIAGHTLVCLNGGPHPGAQPNDAVSLYVLCADQAQVDEYWSKLTADGGKEIQCGWLQDKYGFRWQIVPQIMHDLLQDPDRGKAGRAMKAMMQMVKLDVAAIEAAARGAQASAA